MLLFGVGHTFLDTVGLETLVHEAAVLGREPIPSGHPQPRDALCRQVDADLAHDTAERLGAIRCPTLVVGGEEDTIFFREHHEMLAARIPNARLVMFPKLGHSPAIENNDAFNEALAAFLAEQR